MVITERTNFASRILTLERRREHLQSKIETGAHSEKELPFLKAEESALELALECMRRVRLSSRGTDTLAVLRDLVEAEEGEDTAKLRTALQAARILIEEFPEPEGAVADAG